ncbi:MAG: urease accessory UreF family protein, partial [Pseudomonadota bacterium]
DETCIQGRAFLEAYTSAWGEPDPALSDVDAVALPIAVARATRQSEISLPATLNAYAIAMLSNLVSAAIRLGAIGQFDGQRTLAALMPITRELCRHARVATRDSIGSVTFMADLASLQHETQTTRLFRS